MRQSRAFSKSTAIAAVLILGLSACSRINAPAPVRDHSQMPPSSSRQGADRPDTPIGATVYQEVRRDDVRSVPLPLPDAMPVPGIDLPSPPPSNPDLVVPPRLESDYART